MENMDNDNQPQRSERYQTVARWVVLVLQAAAALAGLWWYLHLIF